MDRINTLYELERPFLYSMVRSPLLVVLRERIYNRSCDIIIQYVYTRRQSVSTKDTEIEETYSVLKQFTLMRK